MRSCVVAAAVLALAGCGDDKTKPPAPTDAQIKASVDEQKQVEVEERGTPVVPKGKKR